eukprot:1156406-Pelagomonas_calceolata.AAC.5
MLPCADCGWPDSCASCCHALTVDGQTVSSQPERELTVASHVLERTGAKQKGLEGGMRAGHGPPPPAFLIAQGTL